MAGWTSGDLGNNINFGCLLLYQNGTLYPIDIKKAASLGKAAIKNFSVLDS